MTSLRRRLTWRIASVVAVVQLVPAAVILFRLEQMVWAAVDAEMKGVVVGGGLALTEEVAFQRGLDWDEEVYGPDPLGTRTDIHEGPRFESGQLSDFASEYEWLIREPDGTVYAVTEGFPKIRPEFLVVDDCLFADGVLSDGRPARLAGTIVGYDNSYYEMTLEQAVRSVGPRVRKDWRAGARPGFEDFGRFDGPYEVIAARSVAAELGNLRRAQVWVGVGSTLTCILSALIVAVAVRRGLRPLEQLSRRFKSLDYASLHSPIDGIEDQADEIRAVAKNAERSRQRLADAFEREQRFSAGVAHELMTPLSGLRSTLEVSIVGEDDPAAMQRAADRCLEIVESMQGSIESLLDVGGGALRAGELELAPIELSLAVTDVLVLHGPRLSERRMGTDVDVDPKLAVLGDRVLLDRILMNLVGNAVEHGEPRTTIQIRAHQRHGLVELSVTNQLDAPSENLAEHALETFWRANAHEDSDRHHAGLGLPLAQECATAMSGQLGVQVIRDTFVATVQLPSAEPED